MNGVVVAASRPAADAGAAALAAGGSAVDAAVAAGFALCVVDPGNCGLGGYGGFLTYAPPGIAPVLVDFNTWVPAGADPARFRAPGSRDRPLDGAVSIAPPAVVPGLLTAHERFGRLPLRDVLAPAARLASDGFAIGRDVARGLAEHWDRTRGGYPELAAIFFPDGRVPAAGERLVQPELAATLEAIAAEGAAAFRAGPIVDAICAAGGGSLDGADFLEDRVAVGPAGAVAFGGATLYGPPRATSGTGVLFGALERIDPGALGASRSEAYVSELAGALAAAWRERTEKSLLARHTTTLAAADAGGGLVALTFTHGSLLYGSGLVAPGTGIVLNAGANLFATGPDGPSAVTNMAPVVIAEPTGVRHALGGTGGPRIPAILLTAVVDVVHYGAPLAAALAAPHLSVRADDGELEAEPELLAAAGRGHVLGPSDFGPAAGVTVAAEETLAAIDPRFDSGVGIAVRPRRAQP